MAHTKDKEVRERAPKESKKDSTHDREQQSVDTNNKAKEPKAPKPDRGVAPGITG